MSETKHKGSVFRPVEIGQLRGEKKPRP